MMTKSVAASTAYGVLVGGKEMHPEGMSLKEIIANKTVDSSDQATIYFALKELADKGIVLYGENKRGREKLFTIVSTKTDDEVAQALAGLESKVGRVSKVKTPRGKDLEAEAIKTGDVAPATDVTVKDWINANICMYVSYSTCAIAAAVKFNKYVYNRLSGKGVDDTYPQWIRDYAKNVWAVKGV